MFIMKRSSNNEARKKKNTTFFAYRLVLMCRQNPCFFFSFIFSSVVASNYDFHLNLLYFSSLICFRFFMLRVVFVFRSFNTFIFHLISYRRQYIKIWLPIFLLLLLIKLQKMNVSANAHASVHAWLSAHHKLLH